MLVHNISHIHWHQKGFKIKNNYFLSQPHQVFFVLSFTNAIILFFLFVLSFKGIIVLGVGPIFFHFYGLIFLFFTPAFLGFLFTVFPKFLATNIISKKFYLTISSLFFIATILFIIGSIFSYTLLIIAMLFIMIAHSLSFKKLYELYKSSKVKDRQDSFWILLGFFFGLMANSIFIFDISGIFYLEEAGNIAKNISIYLYLFLLSFSVAQKMIPAFSNCQISKNRNLLKYISTLLFLIVVMDSAYPIFLFIMFIIAVKVALSIIIAMEIYRWKLPFPNINPLVWTLHISIFWVPIAFFIDATSDILEYYYNIYTLNMGIHTLLVGFIFTTLIGFGTRVTLGHSGNSIISDKFITFLLILSQVVVVSRLTVSIASIFDINFMILFDISSALWILTFTLFYFRFIKTLIFKKKNKFSINPSQ